MSLSTRVALFAFALVCARSVSAQDAEVPWQPAGPVPVDQAGAGRRGYVLPVEGADVAAPGASQISVHTVAANNSYREDENGFLITQRYEAHTLAFGFRRGLKVPHLRAFEIGAQVQFDESDAGMMNGFIGGVERAFASMTGHTSAINPLREPGAVAPPLGTVITKDNQLVYQSPGNGSGVGDVYVVAKARLADGLAARAALNIAGASEFSEGNFAGLGVSLDRRLNGWAVFHGDLRTNILLDRTSQWGLPLRRATLAFSAGPEFRLTRLSSLNLQIDGGATPYLPAGANAFDEGYGDVTLGFNRRIRRSRRPLLVQFYARENMNLPLQVRWNTDPDFAIGFKISVSSFVQ